MYWSPTKEYISFLLFCITFCPSKHAKTLMKILIWICIFQQCGIAYSTRYIRNISNAEHKAWSEWSHLWKQISLISSESLALCVLMFMCPNVRWLLLYVWYHKKFKNIKIFWLLAYSQTLNWCQVCLAWIKSYTELWFLAVMSTNNECGLADYDENVQIQKH